MNNVNTSYDQIRWANIFDGSRFEIYKNTTKTYVIKEIYNAIGGPEKNILKTLEILDNIKTRFFKLNKLTFSFIFEQKD